MTWKEGAMYTKYFIMKKPVFVRDGL